MLLFGLRCVVLLVLFWFVALSVALFGCVLCLFDVVGVFRLCGVVCVLMFRVVWLACLCFMLLLCCVVCLCCLVCFVVCCV